MSMLKRLFLLLITTLIMIGVCGCMKKTELTNNTRKESDAEYVEMMKDYMEQKYTTSFDIVETVLPASGINTGMEVNTLVLRDCDGCVTNVRAKFGTPYNFYDDYVQVRTAYEILSKMKVNTEIISALGLYATVRTNSIESIDTSPENVTSLTLVAKVPNDPEEASLQALYELYDEICSNGYSKVYFLVGFVKDSSDFDAAVENYSLHGKSKWSDYKGEFYAYLRTTSVELSFEDFKNSVEK